MKMRRARFFASLRTTAGKRFSERSPPEGRRGLKRGLTVRNVEERYTADEF